jgi:thymidylate kinase
MEKRENEDSIQQKVASPPLNLIVQFCKELEKEGILYCHWKSNNAIARSASGENDLDLLVDRSAVGCFSEIMYRLRFKEVRLHPEQEIKGIQDYYGYDDESGLLVHVHAHYQLTLGHDMTKNYHLPLEKPYLESATQDILFKLPSPEFEFIVFVIRMIIKHCTWDVIIARQGSLSSGERQEFDYLSARVDEQIIEQILETHLPFIEKRLFYACCQALRPGYSYWSRIKTGHQLQRSLKAYARRSQISDIYLKLFRRVVMSIKRRIFKFTPKGRFASGGAIVAIIGGDGAGKSTVIDELFHWLSPDFEIHKIHMGKPAWSLTTIFLRGLLKLGRSVGLYPFSRAPEQFTNDLNLLVFPGYPWLIREICTARDRYLTYVKARRLANNGQLVISDRYPLPQIKMMDGAQVSRMTNNYHRNRFIRLMIEIENKYYAPILMPDILIVLKVDPDIAVQRKLDEDAASVRARSGEIWEIEWRQLPASIVDASQSKSKVLSELKDMIWSSL